MKYIYNAIIVLFLLFYNSIVYSQIQRDELGEYGIINDDLIRDFEDMGIIRETPCCSDEESLPDISFGYSITSALNAHYLISRARQKAIERWFKKQHSILEKEIEKQLGKEFSNFEEARNFYFKNLERQNAVKNVRGVKNKYYSKVRSKRGVKKRSLKDLKLLDIRRRELNLGNINNPEFRSFSINGTPVSQIRNQSQINSLRKNILASFENNEWKLYNENNIYQTLFQIQRMGDYDNRNNWDYDILDKLLVRQINHYNSFDRWKQLDLMQIYLNNVRVNPPHPLQEVMPDDFATPSYIENYARYERTTNIGLSVFHPDYYKSIEQNIVSNGSTPRHVANTIARRIHREQKQRALNNLLDKFSNADLKTQNVIETLKYSTSSSQASYLSNNSHIGEDIYNILNVSALSEKEKAHAKDIVNTLSNYSLSDEQKFNKLLTLENQYNPTPQNVTQTELDKILKKYSEEFRRRGNTQFADYLESLLPIDPRTFTQGERWDIIKLIKKEKVNYTLALARRIVGVTYDSFKPIIEFALMEVGGTAAIKLLSKLPIKYLTTPIKNIISRLRAPGSKAWNGFQHAKKFGFKSYDDFVKYFKELGIKRSELGVQVHHLFEKRLAQSPAIRNFLGSDHGKWKSIVLTTAEHQRFTTAWVRAIGRRGGNPGWTGYTSDNVTVEAMKRAAKQIYKDYPEILKALGL